MELNFTTHHPMEILPDMLNTWLLNYGSLALFALLALGIVALPVPEETLLIFSGFLVHQGTLSLLPTILAAFFGSAVGITLSYIIGTTGGLYLIKKYGPYVRITEVKITKVHNWFERYGKWVLFVGYFIPGVRHFTGIVAGISTLEYHHFALYAYTGAFFWISLFLSIGYFFGGYHRVFFEFIEQNIEQVLSGAFLLFLMVLATAALIQKAKKKEKL